MYILYRVINAPEQSWDVFLVSCFVIVWMIVSKVDLLMWADLSDKIVFGNKTKFRTSIGIKRWPSFTRSSRVGITACTCQWRDWCWRNSPASLWFKLRSLCSCRGLWYTLQPDNQVTGTVVLLPCSCRLNPWGKNYATSRCSAEIH